MDGRSLRLMFERLAQARDVLALGAALAAGALALISPIAALLVLALLGARALLNAQSARIDPAALAGPALAAAIVGAFVGLDGAIGVLFVWRLYADTRWSVREAARLAVSAGRPGEASPRALAHAWTTPLFGLTMVAFTAPHMIAGLPLDLPHAPLWLSFAAGAIAAMAVFDWALQRAADWRLGELALAPAAHLLAHHIVFVLAFGLMIDVSAGIVALAAWRLTHAAPLRTAQASFTAVP